MQRREYNQNSESYRNSHNLAFMARLPKDDKIKWGKSEMRR